MAKNHEMTQSYPQSQTEAFDPFMPVDDRDMYVPSFDPGSPMLPLGGNNPVWIRQAENIQNLPAPEKSLLDKAGEKLRITREKVGRTCGKAAARLAGISPGRSKSPAYHLSSEPAYPGFDSMQEPASLDWTAQHDWTAPGQESYAQTPEQTAQNRFGNMTTFLDNQQQAFANAYNHIPPEVRGAVAHIGVEAAWGAASAFGVSKGENGKKIKIDKKTARKAAVLVATGRGGFLAAKAGKAAFKAGAGTAVQYTPKVTGFADNIAQQRTGGAYGSAEQLIQSGIAAHDAVQNYSNSPSMNATFEAFGSAAQFGGQRTESFTRFAQDNREYIGQTTQNVNILRNGNLSVTERAQAAQALGSGVMRAMGVWNSKRDRRIN